MTPSLANPVRAIREPRVAAPVEFPRLLAAESHRVKRGFDLAVATLAALAALPICIIIALAIVLESGGPALFGHTRIGRGRKPFRVWKFRTMIVEGDEILRQHLAENPAAALEWDLTHKLKDDPRITRVGRLLRRTSLDELPQLWNVLRGEMSIVGPRPIVEAEIPKYGPAFRLYTHVAPGLTGLWQVSGRNDTSYGRRVELDTEYIRRWTPALDFKVVLSTVKVVLVGTGAY
jgi:Undecaprenyl-phosphate galactose phosphotransferase WbaP